MSRRLVMILPNGNPVTLGAYVAAWRRLKTLPPEAEVGGWEWYPLTAADVLRRMWQGVVDRINRRGGLVIRDGDRGGRRARRRFEHRRRATVVRCRWCGQEMKWRPERERFCDRSCREAHG